MDIQKLDTRYINYWMAEYSGISVPKDVCAFIHGLQAKFQLLRREQRKLQPKAKKYVYEKNFDLSPEIIQLRIQCEKITLICSALHDDFSKNQTPRCYQQRVDRMISQGEKITAWCDTVLQKVHTTRQNLFTLPSSRSIDRAVASSVYPSYSVAKPKDILDLLMFSRSPKNKRNN